VYAKTHNSVVTPLRRRYDLRARVATRARLPLPHLHPAAELIDLQQRSGLSFRALVDRAVRGASGPAREKARK
jgi:hypothetical protein